VTAAGFETTTTPWDLGRRLDVTKAVDDELERENSPNLAVRLWRRTVGHEGRTLKLQPTWHDAQAPTIDRILKDAAKGTAVAAKDATLDTSDGWLHLTPDQPGRALDSGAARRVLHRRGARPPRGQPADQ